MSFTVYPGRALNTTVCWSRCQLPYHMERFVSEGSATVYLTILNYISLEAELQVDCSKAFWNIVNTGLPLLTDDAHQGSRRQNVIHGVLLPTWESYRMFSVERIWVQASVLT